MVPPPYLFFPAANVFHSETTFAYKKLPQIEICGRNEISIIPEPEPQPALRRGGASSGANPCRPQSGRR